jgi:hypothetical protein
VRYGLEPAAEHPPKEDPTVKPELVTKKGAPVSSPQWVEIDDRKAVRALAGGATRRYLSPFFHREQTASEAAKQLGLPLRPFCNKIDAMIALGLLRETRVVPRKGRAIRYFRTPGEEFFVPINAISEDVIVAIENRYQRQFLDSLLTVGAHLGGLTPTPIGFRVHVDAERGGDAHFDLATRPGVSLDLLNRALPPFFTSWTILELSPPDARELQMELAQLLARYQARATPGGTRYLTRWGLVRLPEE